MNKNLLEMPQAKWARELERRGLRRVALSDTTSGSNFGYVIPSAEREARRRGIPEADQMVVIPFASEFTAEAWDELILLATYYKYRRLKGK